METILWFNWSSCNQQDSNIASKEITVKKASSLKTEEMKCNRSTIMETLNSFHPGKRCGILPSSKWREGSDSVWQGARGGQRSGRTFSPHLGKSTDRHAAYRSFRKWAPCTSCQGPLSAAAALQTLFCPLHSGGSALVFPGEPRDRPSAEIP